MGLNKASRDFAMGFTIELCCRDGGQGVNFQRNVFCWELNENFIYVQKVLFPSPPISGGLNSGVEVQKVLARNCMKCSGMHSKIM